MAHTAIRVDGALGGKWAPVTTKKALVETGMKRNKRPVAQTAERQGATAIFPVSFIRCTEGLNRELFDPNCRQTFSSEAVFSIRDSVDHMKIKARRNVDKNFRNAFDKRTLQRPACKNNAPQANHHIEQKGQLSRRSPTGSSTRKTLSRHTSSKFI